jgi:hypothetical protein
MVFLMPLASDLGCWIQLRKAMTIGASAGYCRNLTRGFELGQKTKGVRIAQSIREQHPIEVIALVLDDAGVKALDGAIDPLTRWL